MRQTTTTKLNQQKNPTVRTRTHVAKITEPSIFRAINLKTTGLETNEKGIDTNSTTQQSNKEIYLQYNPNQMRVPVMVSDKVKKTYQKILEIFQFTMSTSEQVMTMEYKDLYTAVIYVSNVMEVKIHGKNNIT